MHLENCGMWKFFKDFFIYGFASIFSKIAAVFLMPVYTNILTREEYGAMAMLVSTKGIIDLISNLNIHAGIARDYYEKDIDRRTLVSTGFWSILSLSCSILCIMLLTRKFWTESILNLHGYDLCFIFVLLSIPAGSLMSYFSILTRFKKKPQLYFIGTIINLAISLSIAIYTVVVLRIGIIGIFIGTLAAEIFSICFYGYINKEYLSFKFKWEYLKRALKFSVPLLPAILSWWIDSSFGQILIGRFLSLSELGTYSLALQLASVFSLIGTALNNVWSPYLYENYRKSSFYNDVKKLFIALVSILCLISCTLSLLSKEIILLLSNANYISASSYLTLLCIPMSFYLLFPIASSGISISRDTKYTGLSYITGSSLNILFLVITLPRFGVYSVPIGLGISRIITYALLSYVTKKKVAFTLPNHIMLILIVIVLLCFIINHINIDFVYRIILTLLIDCIILYWINDKLKFSKIIQSLLKRAKSSHTN